MDKTKLKRWADDTIKIIQSDIKKYSEHSTGKLGKSLTYKINDNGIITFLAEEYFYNANEKNDFLYTKRAFSEKRINEYKKIIVDYLVSDLKK